MYIISNQQYYEIKSKKCLWCNPLTVSEQLKYVDENARNELVRFKIRVNNMCLKEVEKRKSVRRLTNEMYIGNGVTATVTVFRIFSEGIL